MYLGRTERLHQDIKDAVAEYVDPQARVGETSGDNNLLRWRDAVRQVDDI